MDALYQRTFKIALKTVQLHACCRRTLFQSLLNLLERLSSIETRLSLPQQVEIGPLRSSRRMALREFL